MKDMMGNGFIANADAFSVATQIYVRMRRGDGAGNRCNVRCPK